jgi:hypothetical protein
MSLRVKCPRCGKYWTARQGTDSIECTCHLYCNEGTKPSDCTVTWINHTGQYAWPVGVHGGGRKDDYDNQTNVNYYCSVHGNYYIKAPVLIEVDWSQAGRRAKPSERYFGDGT